MKRPAKDYANENAVHTVKILEALEGAGAFEPVPLARIVDRTGIKYDKCRRVLLTLEILGWAKQTEKNEWTLGKQFFRFARAASELNGF